MNVVKLELTSDLWMPLLDTQRGLYESEVEDSVNDYILCKRLFCELNAERCLASTLECYCEFDDAHAGDAFLFTREGPQKLVRPLEEGRAPRRAGEPGGERELSNDPVTGLPNWVLIVDKPFRDLAL